MIGDVIHIKAQKKHLKKSTLAFYLLIIIILMLGVFILIGLSQQTLVLKTYDITDSSVPERFDGYRIVHITDFHSGIKSSSAAEVIKMTAAQFPDIICLTGDIVDGTSPDFVPVEELVAGLVDIAPVYAVSGNNEHYSSSINAEINWLYEEYGVINMDDRTVTIFDGGTLTLSGIADMNPGPYLYSQVMELSQNKSSEGFHILLYHRANEFDHVVAANYDLVLSGHLHGGVIRIPFVGGILSPYDTFFPKYSGGLYEKSGVTLISNCGIGNNYIFPRVYNPPEVVLLVLHKG